MGFGAPASWFVHLAVFRRRVSGLYHQVGVLPGFSPASEFHPCILALSCSRSLEVPCPHSATQLSRATTSGPSHRSRSCCVLALTMCLDALLPRQSPRCLSTGRAHGVHPSELDLTEIATPLGAPSPLAISSRLCDRTGHAGLSERPPRDPVRLLSFRFAIAGSAACVRLSTCAASSPLHQPSAHSPRLGLSPVAASLQGFLPSAG